MKNRFTDIGRRPRILLCEDDFLIALDLEDDIKEAGAEVFASARSQKDALKMIEHDRPDAALVDLELADGACIELVQSLAERDIPFAIISAFTRPPSPPPPLEKAPWFLKPVAFEEMIDALSDILQGSDHSELRANSICNACDPSLSSRRSAASTLVARRPFDTKKALPEERLFIL